MKGFDLPKIYLYDPEVLLRNTRAKLKKVLAVVSEDSLIRRSLTLEFAVMANKSLNCHMRMLADQYSVASRLITH
jgi:hypothetical protein